MPSCITHQLIAEYAEQSFPPEALSAISDARAYYFLGAQGPDLLFFYRVLSGKENNLGRLLHRKHRYAVFSAFYDLLRGDFFRGEAREKAAAYIYGYLTHYCADVAFHPFVYAYLEAHGGEGFLHQRIENDWDVYFLREKRGREAEDYTFPFSVKRIADDGVLYLLFSFAFAETVRRLFKLFSRRMLFLPKRLEKGGRFFRRKAALFPPVSFAHPGKAVFVRKRVCRIYGRQSTKRRRAVRHCRK